MSVFGAGDVVGSLVFGRLQDKIGKKPVILTGGVLTIGVSVVLMLIDQPTLQAKYLYVYYILALVNGLIDGAFNTTLYSTLGIVFKDKVEPAFSMFRLFQATST
eukprot:CAMPEP_0168514860 /NCGR_PEP_ID=MMETSP0405-20121227/4375_1 /TAXON_ID=498012 /ORGANISM="Trichosphaerium sp, Strain Am-I-7 wt" /LENGTH=103 /DNA_ID=CAMNT_0008534095 /DNA_START=1 /DNA_END=308 /DNA_ORIENTATION=-